MKASALIAAFLQTAHTSAPSPSPENLSPGYTHVQHPDKVNTATKTALQRCVHLKDLASWLCEVSTHLPDVPHLIMEVIDRPPSCHHLLLSVRARPPHYSVHFGPMMLQRGFWHPIGHVSEVLRETGSHRSGFCSHPPTEAHKGCHCICVLMCMLVCRHAHLQVDHTFVCVCTCWRYVHSIRYFQHHCC